MRHELLQIIRQAILNRTLGLKSVLATVVALEGSSYRRPGVRMLLAENGLMTGAVSGGCVEKEVWRRAQPVFQSGVAEMMTYDGRYRLGCEGLLYLLLEPVELNAAFVKIFEEQEHTRQDWTVRSWFRASDGAKGNMGSVLEFGTGEKMAFADPLPPIHLQNSNIFSQILKPCFRMVLFGAEHDAAALAQMAAQLGWLVEVVSTLQDPKTQAAFPGASLVRAESPQTYPYETLDPETALVLMTHQYALDLRYLSYLHQYPVSYLGILGSTQRSARLQNELMDANPDLPADFWDSVYSPAGLNLGAETPQEIAMSILSEVLAVTRAKNAVSLRNLKGRIHS